MSESNPIVTKVPALYRAPMPTVVLTVGDFITGAFQSSAEDAADIELIPTGWCFMFAGSIYAATGLVPWNAFVFESHPSPYGAPPVMSTSTVRMVVGAVAERAECDPGNVNVSGITPMLWDGPPWPVSPEHLVASTVDPPAS